MPKTKSKPSRPVPSLVIEFHYDDGDVGAHPATEEEARLFQGFSTNPAHKPSHILIRIDSERGQELSNALHEASVKHLKSRKALESFCKGISTTCREHPMKEH